MVASPETVDPVSPRRGRYADTPAAALLTGFGVANVLRRRRGFVPIIGRASCLRFVRCFFRTRGNAALISFRYWTGATGRSRAMQPIRA